MAKKKFSFRVTVELEENPMALKDENANDSIDKEGLADYIVEAVECWGGQFPPDDVLFTSNIKKVTVK